MASLALIGLGSNLGDREAALEGALADLAAARGLRVAKVSSFHETLPVGGPSGQGAFLNAAAALEVTLDPFELLRLLMSVEARHGRVRTVRWAARTLDLDLLLMGDLVIDTPELTVPHPRLAERRFVLAPLCEIAPDARHPTTKRTVAQMLRELDQSGS
jgi:2-amino-4-hydroxy-6-hydroxymethyldihydropteridine diphosphokinase